MGNQEDKYSIIVSNNKLLLDNIIEYINNSLNITTEELYNNLKFSIRSILKSIRHSNNKAVQLRLERKKVREDLDDLERAYCMGDNLDSNETGRNTGGRVNTVELRQLQKLQLRENLKELLLQSLLLEKSLESNNKLIRTFINLIPQKQYIQVMEMTYFDCMSNVMIAAELNYSTDFVDQARKRGIAELTKILLKRKNGD